MKVAYKYRIYPNDTQKQVLEQFLYTYNTLYNIGVDITKTIMIRNQRESKDIRTVKVKEEDGTIVEKNYPKYKYPSTLTIQKYIYHLKDDEDCEYWNCISNPKTLLRKDELKALFKSLPVMTTYYIAQAIAKAKDSIFNPNMAHKDPKKKVYHSITVDDITETDLTNLKFHKYEKYQCSYSVQIKNNSALKVKDGKKYGYFNIAKVGLVKLCYHRPIPNGSKFDQVTIERYGNEWYLTLCGLERKDEPLVKEVTKTVGIDMNTDNRMYVSDGQIFSNPVETLKKLNKDIKRLQKRDGKNKKDCKTKTKRVYGSKNYWKNLLKIKKKQHKITNIKRAMLDNASTKLVNENDAIFIEDLNIKAMQKYNGSMVQKNNFYGFAQMLEYKALNKGKYLKKIDRFYASSQICSKCGKVHKEMKNLSKRVFRCECGNIIPRDLNAAININNEGLKNLKKTLDN